MNPLHQILLASAGANKNQDGFWHILAACSQESLEDLYSTGVNCLHGSGLQGFDGKVQVRKAAGTVLPCFRVSACYPKSA